MQHETEAEQTTQPKSAAAADSSVARFSDHLITHPLAPPPAIQRKQKM